MRVSLYWYDARFRGSKLTVVKQKNIFLFSGQGSQYFQMGKHLFDEVPTFKNWMRHLDVVAREQIGCSIIDTIYDPSRTKAEVFDRLLLTSPAIFMIQYAMARTLIEAGVTPDLTLGASMGSFAAGAVSGFMSPEEALLAVVRQAQIVESHCSRGAMLAVFAEERVHSEDLLRVNSEIAAFNFRSHFAISTTIERLQPIEGFLRARGITFQKLPVPFAFHSRWIDEARVPFESSLRSLRMQPGMIPMVCCATGQRFTTVPASHFWHIARHPIRFQQTIAALEMTDNYRYIDIGPAGTLATFLKYGLPPSSASTTHTLLSPFASGLEGMLALRQQGFR